MLLSEAATLVPVVIIARVTLSATHVMVPICGLLMVPSHARHALITVFLMPITLLAIFVLMANIRTIHQIV